MNSRSTLRRERRVEPVHIERDDRAIAASASRSIRPWPISPPAPVMRTTGLRTPRIILNGCRAHCPASVDSASTLAALRRGRCAYSPRRHDADAPVRLHRRTMRVDYFHTRRSEDRRERSRSTASSTTAVAWEPHAARRSDQPRQVPVRGRARRGHDRSIRAASRRSTANGRRPAKQKNAHRTFHESLRFPWPREPVTVVAVKKRQPDNSVRADLDHRDRSGVAVRQRGGAVKQHAGQRVDGVRERPAAEKVDLLVIGEGYTAAEMPKFHADVQATAAGAVQRGAVQEPAGGFQRARRWTCRPPRAASTARTPACFAGRRCRPNTTSSIPSATC